MMSRTVAGFAFVAAIAAAALAGACAGDMTGPNAPAIPAHGLLASLLVPGPCLGDQCGPLTPLQHEGVVTLTNTGNTDVFVRLCGSLPAVEEQEFVDGQWVADGNAVTCVNGPVSALVAARDSLQFNRVFDAGTRRLIVSAATDTALETEAASTSAAVVIR
jgi:hypothetical protein